MGAVFRWVKYIYEWCKNFALKGGAGVGGGMPHGAMGGPIGNIFYVNGGADGVTTGADANPGTRSQPFLTIDHALDQCVNNQDDYILCWNTHNQDTFPITIDKSCVHIIGLASPNGQKPGLEGQGDDAAAFTFGIAAEGCEIAGFNMSAGAAHACIEFVGGNNQTWIHHCTFGHYWLGGGQDGILFPSSSYVGVIIEDCWFYGDKGPVGKLSRYGIGALIGSIYQSTIRNNTFVMVPNAIWLGGTNGEVDIIHNIIGIGQDAADGEAILLGPACTGFVVDDNVAMHGNAQGDYDQGPYRDLGAPNNHWGRNYRGNAVIEPVIV